MLLSIICAAIAMDSNHQPFLDAIYAAIPQCTLHGNGNRPCDHLEKVAEKFHETAALGHNIFQVFVEAQHCYLLCSTVCHYIAALLNLVSKHINENIAICK